MAFELGPSWISHHKAEFTRRSSGWLRSNYEVSRSVKQSVGLSVHIKIDYMMFKWMGFDASLFTNINALHSFVGLELNLNLGYIRR
jgi:hypothetical protein